MSADDTGFVSLADAFRLRAPAPAAPIPDRGSISAHAPAPVQAPSQPTPVTPDSSQVRAAIRDARVFRAALSEVFEARSADLLGELAAAVLVRELKVSPVDVAALARRLIAEREADEPLRVRVGAADASIVCDLPVVVDPSLDAGDAILECRSGSINARLAVRLSTLLSELP